MSPQMNNIFAAILIAGLVAMMAGFVSHIVYKPKKLEAEAYPIAALETAPAAGGVAAPATAEPVTDLLATADIAQGEKLFKLCASCHSIDAGGPNRVGPNLSGVMKKGHTQAAGFAYSDAFKAKAGAPWTVEEMNTFLWNPKKAIPGTKMAYAGMKKPEDRAAVIKYLQSK